MATTSQGEGTSASALRDERDSAMLLGTFAASHSGLATDANTDWTLGEEASENACGEIASRPRWMLDYRAEA